MSDSNARRTTADLRQILAADGQYSDEQLDAILQFVEQTGSVQNAMAALEQLELLRKAA